MTIQNDDLSEILRSLHIVLKTQENFSKQMAKVIIQVEEQSKLLKKLVNSREGNVPASFNADLSSSAFFLDQAFKRGNIPEKAKQTFEAISRLQKELKRPVRVEDIDNSGLTNSKRPTLYEHVRKLENARLLTSGIGAELGLSSADNPPNAKYYGVTTHSLYDVSVLTQLPEELSLTAQKMITLQEGVEKPLSLDEIAKATGRSDKAEVLVLEQLFFRNLIRKHDSDKLEYYIPQRA